MVKKLKMCTVCGMNPAVVPDRNLMGRPIKRVCGRCHALRLIGDLKEILRIRKEKRERDRL